MSSNYSLKPLYNSRIIKTYRLYMNKKYPHISFNEILEYSKIKPYQVDDEGHWFTQENVDLFYKKLVQETGNRNIAKEAGRFGGSPEAVGSALQLFKGFISPLRAYEIFGKVCTKYFIKSSLYKSRKIGPNRIEITVVPFQGIQEKEYQCENRLGYFEAIAGAYDYKLPKIEHPECMFKDGRICRYVVTIEKSAIVAWNAIRNIFILLSFLFIAGTFFLHLRVSLSVLAPALMTGLIMLNAIRNFIEEQKINEAMNVMRDSSERLVDQINVNYNNALMINELGLVISKEVRVDGIISKVINILKQRLDYDRILLFLSDKMRTKLEYVSGFGLSEEQTGLLKKLDLSLNSGNAKNVFTASFNQQKPFLINDVHEKSEMPEKEDIAILRQLGSRSFVSCPLTYEDDALGLLCVDNLNLKRTLLQSDLNLLMGIAPVIGVSIYNAIHHQDMLEKERIAEELRLGRDIQTNLLPHKSPEIQGLNVHGIMQPAKEIGGDYYDFIIDHDHQNPAIIIGDISGKGVAAGLLMAMVKSAVHIISASEASPKNILKGVNSILYQNLSGDKFMSMLYLIWDKEHSRFLYSSAGHENILVYRNSQNKIEVIQSGGIILGLMPDIDSYLEEKEIIVDSGDKILLYTDGATDAHNENKDRFGMNNLVSSFKKYGLLPHSHLINKIREDIFSFIGSYPQYDDVTLVSMEIK